MTARLIAPKRKKIRTAPLVQLVWSAFQAAKALNVTVEDVRKFAHDGELDVVVYPHKRAERMKFRFSPDACRRFLVKHERNLAENPL